MKGFKIRKRVWFASSKGHNKIQERKQII